MYQVACNPTGTGDAISFEDMSACRAAFARLSGCCPSPYVVRAYLFKYLVEACVDRARATNATCQQLLDDGTVAASCQRLADSKMCTSNRVSCSGGSSSVGGPNGGTCGFHEQCEPEGVHDLDCYEQGDGRPYKCVCTLKYQKVGEFESDRVCGPDLDVTIIDANLSCGWDVAVDAAFR